MPVALKDVLAVKDQPLGCASKILANFISPYDATVVQKLKAAGELSEDGLHDLEAEVQKLTDRFVKSVDDHLKHKEAEIMKV